MNLTVTLFGQMITFAVLVWFVRRVLWEPLTALMADRSRRIEDGLTAAERGRHQEELARAQATKLIREAKSKAAEILAQAEERRAEIAEEARREAVQERARVLAAATAEIDHKTAQARERLRAELGGLVIEGARRVLGAEIDGARHGALIDTMTGAL